MTGQRGPEKLRICGAPSLEELRATPGFPGPEALARGPVAVIECVEEIPCNPCETSCPHGAITVGLPITRLPVLEAEKCRGCGLCIAACPGLAVYLLDCTWSAERALITFPFEYLPLPRRGQAVTLVDRLGEAVCAGEVIRVNTGRRNDRTALVSVAFPKRYAVDVVSIQRLPPEMQPAPGG